MTDDLNEKTEASKANEIDLKDIGVNPDNVKHTWVILLFIYSAIASLMPVWILLQPRDYINSHQLIVGLSLIFLSLVIFPSGNSEP